MFANKRVPAWRRNARHPRLYIATDRFADCEQVFEVYYYAHSGYPGSYMEPPEPPEWGAEQVLIAGKDITATLADEDVQFFDDCIEEHIVAEQKRYAAQEADYFDALAEESRTGS